MFKVRRTLLSLVSCMVACMAGAALPFHDSFAGNMQPGWFPDSGTTLTLTTPASAGIVSPSAPFDGDIGRLATPSTFNPTTTIGGRVFVGWPYASDVNYTLSCRFYIPAATTGTTATVGFAFYTTYKFSYGNVLLQYSPSQRLSIYMSTFPPIHYYSIHWQPGMDFPAFTAPAWHTLQVALYGGTARVLLDGNFVGLADWTSQTNGGVIGGYGLRHDMSTTGAHIPSLITYIDEFHATPTANSAKDWQLFQ